MNRPRSDIGQVFRREVLRALEAQWVVRRQDEEALAHASLDGEALCGQYLCEQCFDAMTDEVLTAAESPTGGEMAQGVRCARGEAW